MTSQCNNDGLLYVGGMYGSQSNKEWLHGRAVIPSRLSSFALPMLRNNSIYILLKRTTTTTS